ncbi:MAG: hypothetical protein FJ215_12955 [Ignavibacteria bacterium]|nr:hypothetical protein [Ignavibacteria bacterium]
MDLMTARDQSLQEFVTCLHDLCLLYSYEGFDFSRMHQWQHQPHAHYLFLFVDACSRNLQEENAFAVARQLNLAANFYYWHIVLSDQVIDSHSGGPTLERMLLLRDLQRRAMRTLCTLFPPESVFWSHLEEYEKQCATALLAERRYYWQTFRPYSEEEFIQIASGKAAIAKIFVIALALQFKRPDLIEPLSRSQDSFHIAYQLSDDLKDWRSDYEAKQYSFILSNVIESHRLENEVNSPTRPDADTIGKMLYYSGIAEMGLDICVEHLREALQLVKQIYCPSWKSTIEQMKAKCIADKKTIATKRREALNKIGIACT